MLLYHYSKERYPVLKTRSLVEGKPKGELLSYDNHISFFFEKPPLENLGTVFGKDHEVWFPGSKLHEHIVDSKFLRKFFYRIVEFPEKTALRYDDSVSIEKYNILMSKIIANKKYEGTNLKDLEKACEGLKGYTQAYFRSLPTRRDYDDIKQKYAATVPHLMIYLEDRMVETLQINEVVIGNSGFPKEKPKSYNW